MKKNKISKNWINKQKRDIYVRKSKIEGYRSRAVYKLQEIEEKYKLIKNGMSVVDLGAAPGSWSEYISRKYKNTRLVSIDLKEMEPIENTFQIKGDFTDENNQKKRLSTDGFTSRIIQHELDHLNGILFVDHLSRLKRDVIIRKMKKFKKEEKIV